MTVNKIEAAHRQLDEAIRLLFENRDPVAIHTLVFAAFHILRDLLKNAGLENWFLEGFRKVIKPEMESRMWGMLNHPANFLKHADRDPEGTLEGIEEEAHDYLILVCCSLYKDLTNDLSLEMKGFSGWFQLFHPDVLTEGPYKEWIFSSIQGMPQWSRAEQLAFGNLHLDQLRSNRR
jgi:hypothetical protein